MVISSSWNLVGFCMPVGGTWSILGPWWFLEKELKKEVVIFGGAEMGSPVGAGVDGLENVKGLL